MAPGANSSASDDTVLWRIAYGKEVPPPAVCELRHPGPEAQDMPLGRPHRGWHVEHPVRCSSYDRCKDLSDQSQKTLSLCVFPPHFVEKLCIGFTKRHKHRDVLTVFLLPPHHGDPQNAWGDHGLHLIVLGGEF